MFALRGQTASMDRFMAVKKMADLNRRLIVSSISAVVIAFLIACCQNDIVRILLLIFVAAFAGIGVWEYAQLAIAKGARPATQLMIICSSLLVVAFYASLHFVAFPQLCIFVLFLSVLSFFINHFKEPQNSLLNIAVEFFGLAYVAVPLSLMLGVLYPVAHEGAPQDGRWWLVYLIVVTKITDVGAYFVGRLWGKHMLSHLSPKKTIEGALSGFLCAILASVAMHFLGMQLFPQDFHLRFSESIWLGALLGALGQIGDLAESLLKRDANVKDSNQLPGLGGVLDMVDSLLITTPIVYFFIKMH
jgi:phosphatidate cytidylyltransferase